MPDILSNVLRNGLAALLCLNLFGCGNNNASSKLGAGASSPEFISNSLDDRSSVDLAGTADGSGGDTRKSSLEDITAIFDEDDLHWSVIQKLQTSIHRFFELADVVSFYESKGAPRLHKYDSLKRGYESYGVELDIEHLFNHLGISVSTFYNFLKEEPSFYETYNTLLAVGYSEAIKKVSEMNFVFQEPHCNSSDGRKVVMAVNRDGKICVSISLLQLIPKDSLDVEVISLFFHEYLHFIGIESEDKAVEFQEFIASNADFFIDEKNLHSVSNIQDKLSLVLTSNMSHFSNMRSLKDEKKYRCDGLLKTIININSSNDYLMRDLVGQKIDSIFKDYCFSEFVSDEVLKSVPRNEVLKLSKEIYEVISIVGKAKSVISAILSPFYKYAVSQNSELVTDSLLLDKEISKHLDENGRWNNDKLSFQDNSFYLKINNSKLTLSNEGCFSLRDPWSQYGPLSSRLRTPLDSEELEKCSEYKIDSDRKLVFVLSPFATDGLIEFGERERTMSYDFVYSGVYSLRVFLVAQDEPSELEASEYKFKKASNLPMNFKEKNDADYFRLIKRRLYSSFIPFYIKPEITSFIQSVFTASLKNSRSAELMIPKQLDENGNDIEYFDNRYVLEYGFDQD